jgi:hypothetical protein
MSKTSTFMLSLICIFGISFFIYDMATYKKPETKDAIQVLNENLTIIKIDGEEYWYGKINNNIVLTPKTKSCNCKIQ